MTKRILKLNELIRHELGQIIASEIEFPLNSLVTITKIDTTPDLKASKVFLSVLPEKQRGTALEILRKNGYRLRNQLQGRLTTKFTPNLQFVIDEQEIYANEVDKLLDEIKTE